MKAFTSCFGTEISGNLCLQALIVNHIKVGIKDKRKKGRLD